MNVAYGCNTTEVAATEKRIAILTNCCNLSEIQEGFGMQKRSKRHNRWRVPLQVLGMGVFADNPKRCLQCGRKIRAGERWRKTLSADGVYNVIEHTPNCRGSKGAVANRSRMNRKEARR
jgi:hypothetical protein